MSDPAEIDRFPVQFPPCQPAEIEQGVDKLVHVLRPLLDFLDKTEALLIQLRGAELPDDLTVTADDRQRDTQVVGNRITESFHLPVGIFQFGGSCRQVGIQFLDLFLGPLPFGDVDHDGQGSDYFTLIVALGGGGEQNIHDLAVLLH